MYIQEMYVTKMENIKLNGKIFFISIVLSHEFC